MLKLWKNRTIKGKKLEWLWLAGFLVVSLLVRGGRSIAESTQSAPSAQEGCTLQAEIVDAVGPATLDLLQRAKSRASEEACSSILLLINTPGGNLVSTRMIVEEILNSSVPILCLVYPSGGHAGSAGAIILQACHVAGAMEATNIGAATPVSGSGESIPEDLRRKLLNDTRSWVEGLTKLRGRSEKFGQDIILEAKAVSAAEALKLGAIDFVATKKQEFLDFAQGRKTRISENKKEVEVVLGSLRPLDLDLRYKIVSFVSDPQVAYVMFMGSLGLLYYEFTHPGLIAPGVFGGVGLIMSMVALHKLEVTWGALLLVLLGLILMVAESFVAGFGALGIGGTISFLIGSMMLFDPETSGVRLPLSLVLSSSLTLGLLTMGIAYLAFNSRQIRRRTGSYDELIGLAGKAVFVHSDRSRNGQMEVNGETWNFECADDVSVGDELRIQSYHGLTVVVEKISH